MHVTKIVLSLSCLFFVGTTFAAVYPEPIWLDTDLSATPSKEFFSLSFNINTDLLQPELYQASASKKTMCTLGGPMNCQLY